MSGTIVDMHVHTVRGAADSSLTPDELIEEAKRIGLSGVNISEHDRVWEARQIQEFRERSGLFVSRGMEVSTDLGHMIVIGLESYLPGIRRATELRRAVDEAGGFMIVAHPFRHFFDPIHFRRDGRPPFEMTPEEAAERMAVFKLVDEMEVANGGCTPRENQFALRVARALGKRGIGASDCHSTQGVGCYTTVFEEELRDPSTSLRAGQAHMLELLHQRRFQAYEGLNVGEFRPYVEQPLPAK
ncbi:MAG: PHP domain-containing protein [Dehalococcoidia bacterium]|nr:PHP domain-containing protein [Dehalococcoidia bacterium]